jgi:hypothetical protein
MAEWQISDVPCVVILATENRHLNYTILDEQGKEVMHQLYPCVPNTTEEIQEFMEWEERLLKENMGLPKKNF